MYELIFDIHFPRIFPPPLRVYTKLNINCLRVCVGHELPVHGGVEGDGEQAQGTAVLKSYLCYLVNQTSVSLCTLQDLKAKSKQL